jgi:hypothetical protein
MKIYETLNMHYPEDLETLDNLDYLARICEHLNEWNTAEILRRQAIDLRTKMFGHEHPITADNQPGGNRADDRIQT